MGSAISRRSFMAVAGAAGLAGVALATGCSGGSGQASSGSGGAFDGKVIIGTLATEDLLPIWVAQDQGLFKESGIDVEVVTFQAATELIAGVQSGEVDLAMTDIMVTATMYAAGTDVQMEWVTLGTTPQQGRFGIMVGPDSTVKSLSDLAGVPIGVGTNTILEYVMDRLMEDAGVPDDQIVVDEMQKLPVRYQAMESGQVAAAALPGSLLALGEASGCTTVADDTKGDNISQSVMIARAAIAGDEAGAKAIATVADVWDEAAMLVNENPEKYRGVLVANANLSDVVADTYPISEYPTCEMPTSAMVDPVLEWMERKGYLSKSLSYDQSTGKFSAK